MPKPKHRKNRRRGTNAAEEASSSPLSSAEPFDFKDLDADDESTPTWYVATMIALLVIGLLWLVVWYVTSGALPISAAGGWNIMIGFGVIMAGMFMAMKWK